MRSLAFVLGLLIPTADTGHAAEPFRYQAGEHGKGKLTYVGDIPVLILQGTPEEMGEQTGVLAVRQGKTLFNFPRDFFRSESANEIRRKNPRHTEADLQRDLRLTEQLLWPQIQKKAASLENSFPKAHLDELDAIVKGGQVDREDLISTNGMFDLGHLSPEQLLFGCSSLIIPPRQSAEKGVLFGRNLDFYHFGYLHQYSLLMVYRSNNPRKHSFASAGFPGFVGSFTGMNDAGLTIASHEVQEPNTTTLFNSKGIPFAMAYRRILEECATIGEALMLLDGIERASVTSLVIADSEGGAVIEVTPDSLAVRRFKDKTGVCTNHFCAMKTPDLKGQFATFKRFDILTRSVAVKKDGGFGIDDVHQGLHAARLFDKNKTDMTIQTFVFEPAKRKVHLSFGNGKVPATDGKLTTIDLNTLWGK